MDVLELDFINEAELLSLSSSPKERGKSSNSPRQSARFTATNVLVAKAKVPQEVERRKDLPNVQSREGDQVRTCSPARKPNKEKYITTSEGSKKESSL